MISFATLFFFSKSSISTKILWRSSMISLIRLSNSFNRAFFVTYSSSRSCKPSSKTLINQVNVINMKLNKICALSFALCVPFPPCCDCWLWDSWFWRLGRWFWRLDDCWWSRRRQETRNIDLAVRCDNAILVCCFHRTNKSINIQACGVIGVVENRGHSMIGKV